MLTHAQHRVERARRAARGRDRPERRRQRSRSCRSRHIFERMAGLYTRCSRPASPSPTPQSIDTVAADARRGAAHDPDRRAALLREGLRPRDGERALAAAAAQRAIFHWGLRQRRAQARAHFAGAQPSPWLALPARRSPTGSWAPRCARASAGACASASRAARRSAPTVLEFFFAIGHPDASRATGSPRPRRSSPQPRRRASKPGSVGPPIPGVEVQDRPTTARSSTRGPHVMQGYFHNERRDRGGDRATAGSTPATSATSTPTATCVITDRLKDLLVTAGGKKVAPQPIEGTRSRPASGSPRRCCSATSGRIVTACWCRTSNGSRAARAQAAARSPSARSCSGARRSSPSSSGEILELNERPRAASRQIKRFALLDRDLTPGGRRAHPHAQGASQDRGPALCARDRRALRRARGAGSDAAAARGPGEGRQP